MNVTSGQTALGSAEPNLAGVSSRLVSELASRIGSLGVELADVAGNLDEVSGRVSNESDQFKELQRAAEHMVAGNREIDRAAKGAQQAASAAGNEIAESRLLIGGAVPIVLIGPMMCGLYLCLFAQMRGQPVEFGEPLVIIE